MIKSLRSSQQSVPKADIQEPLPLTVSQADPEIEKLIRETVGDVKPDPVAQAE